MKRYALRHGEPLAVDAGAIRRDADGFFLVLGDPPPANESRGTVAIVHIRGALSQFDGDGGDSYEAIVRRVEQAVAGKPKPSSVVLCISSPGGLVAGLNECVFTLQRMRTASEIPFIAQINELAASAAFALACACDRRFAPPSAIVGSVGTISTMVSQAARDKAEGLDFRIITSGKRKSDGHPHVAITDAAEQAEKVRTSALAEQFFELAGKALRLPPRRLKSYEAAIFMGSAAQRAGLINAVQSLDETLSGLDKSEIAAPTPAPNEGNITDRRANELDSVPAHGTTWSHKAQLGTTTPGGYRVNHGGQSQGPYREDGSRSRERDRPRPAPGARGETRNVPGPR